MAQSIGSLDRKNRYSHVRSDLRPPIIRMRSRSGTVMLFQRTVEAMKLWKRQMDTRMFARIVVLEFVVLVR